jgi:hypothetical protein
MRTFLLWVSGLACLVMLFKLCNPPAPQADDRLTSHIWLRGILSERPPESLTMPGWAKAYQTTRSDFAKADLSEYTRYEMAPAFIRQHLRLVDSAALKRNRDIESIPMEVRSINYQLTYFVDGRLRLPTIPDTPYDLRYLGVGSKSAVIVYEYIPYAYFSCVSPGSVIRLMQLEGQQVCNEWEFSTFEDITCRADVFKNLPPIVTNPV